MPLPSWGEGKDPEWGPDTGGGAPTGGDWKDEAVALDTAAPGGGDGTVAEDHGFDIGVKPELHPGYDPERQQIKEAGWVESTPYSYEVVDQDPTKALRDWAGNATVYEWDGEQGEVGPESQELELELFGDPEKRSGTGIDFSTYVHVPLFCTFIDLLSSRLIVV